MMKTKLKFDLPPVKISSAFRLFREGRFDLRALKPPAAPRGGCGHENRPEIGVCDQ